MGIVSDALKGSVAIMLLASSILEATRAVMYTDPTVNVQLTRIKQIVNVFAIADRVISARNTRGSTSIVTNPFPES